MTRIKPNQGMILFVTLITRRFVNLSYGRVRASNIFKIFSKNKFEITFSVLYSFSFFFTYSFDYDRVYFLPVIKIYRLGERSRPIEKRPLWIAINRVLLSRGTRPISRRVEFNSKKRKSRNRDKKGNAGEREREQKKSPGAKFSIIIPIERPPSFSPFNPGHDRFQSARISHFRLDDFPCDNYGGTPGKPGSPDNRWQSNRDRFHVDRLSFPPPPSLSLCFRFCFVRGPYGSANVLTVSSEETRAAISFGAIARVVGRC